MCELHTLIHKLLPVAVLWLEPEMRLLTAFEELQGLHKKSLIV